MIIKASIPSSPLLAAGRGGRSWNPLNWFQRPAPPPPARTLPAPSAAVRPPAVFRASSMFLFTGPLPADAAIGPSGDRWLVHRMVSGYARAMAPGDCMAMPLRISTEGDRVTVVFRTGLNIIDLGNSSQERTLVMGTDYLRLTSWSMGPGN